jgi:tRNA(fMet)-specific endonuclease VapC
MKLLLDTNAYVALRRGNAEVVDAVRRSTGVLLSAIVVGELMDGFQGGSRLTENLRLLEETTKSSSVEFVTVGWNTTEWFGRVSSALRKAGTPIPTNDVWIAAHTMEHGARLITADGHFEKVAGIALHRFRP